MPWPPQPSEYLELVDRVAALEEGGSGGGDQELAYAEVDDIIVTDSTTAAAATTIITAPEFTLTEETRVCVEFYSPFVECSSFNGTSACGILLFQGATQVGLLAWFGRSDMSPALLRRFMILAAGTYTFSVRAYHAGSAAAIYGGDGGNDDWLPAYLRVTTATEEE